MERVWSGYIRVDDLGVGFRRIGPMRDYNWRVGRYHGSAYRYLDSLATARGEECILVGSVYE